MTAVDERRERAPGPGSADRRSLVDGATIVLGAAAVGLVALGWSGTDETRVSDLGLISALSPWVFVGSALLVLLAVARLVLLPRLSFIDAALLGAQVLVLHGTPAVVESAARFPVAWLHAGFVNELIPAGQLLTNVDARFNWPGFFTTMAVVADATGTDVVSYLRWAPLVAELLIIALVYPLTRALGASSRTAAVAVWLYATFDWVGQTYFAPQTYGVILQLAFLVIALRTQPRDALTGRRARWFTPLPTIVHLEGRAWWGFLLMTGLAAALAGTHQLSPIVLVLQLMAIVVIGRVRPREVVWVVALLAAAWLTFAAKPYWSGHLETIIGDIGNLDGVLQSAVSDRVGGGSAARQVVLMVRFAFAGALGGLALLGLFRRWRDRRRVDGVVVALAAVPIALVAMQSYGGEIVLRVFLNSLPFLALGAAWAFVPRRVLGRWAGAALAVVLLVGIPAHIVAHYGNERFEQVTAGDVAAVRELYDLAPAGASIVVVTPTMPWRFENYSDFDYVVTKVDAFVDLDPVSIRAALPENSDGTYLFVNNAQLAQLELVNGLGDGYGDQLLDLLDGVPWLTRVYSNDSAVIYRLTEPTGTEE
ncbi:MAG: hypothetical protein KJ548_08295 [Actinobacteria bacterium]|nr:hypothetical protein [Actinomycetota bacterium]